MNLIWCLFAHHLADVALQPSWLIKNKHSHLWAIYEHSMVWGGVLSAVLCVLGMFEPWKAIFLVAGHFIIDAIRYRSKRYDWVYLDQAAHYLQVIIVAH